MNRLFQSSFLNKLVKKTQFLSQPIFKIIGWTPLTFRSILFIPLLIWLRQSYGIARTDFVLLVLSEGGIFLIAFSIFIVTLTALFLRFRTKKESGESCQIATNQEFQTEYKIRKIDWIPFIKIELNWKAPKGVQASLRSSLGILSEAIIPSERGIEDKIIRQLKIVDLFGLARIRFEESENRKIKIFPTLLNLQLKPVFKQFGGGDFISHPLGEPVGDRADLRRYVRGDPLKHILWKVYARTRKLMVREVERAISPEHKVFIYFVASPKDNVAASVTRTALEKGEFGSNFVFLADGGKNPTSDPQEAVEQLINSIHARNQSAQKLKYFLDHAEAEAVSSCFVFASADSLEWSSLLLSSAKSHPIQIQLILAAENDWIFVGENSFRRLIFDSHSRQGKNLKKFEKESEKLIREGIFINVVDRFSGKVVSSLL